MTTAEKTISMFNRLPKEDQNEVTRLVKNLFDRRSVFSEVKLERMGKQEIWNKLQKSEEDIKVGRVLSWDQVKSATRSKYGF